MIQGPRKLSPHHALALLLLAHTTAATAGNLVIVGGGLSASNAAVHRAFLDRRPPGQPGIAIIPSASGEPADSARRFAEALVRHGASPQDIRIVHLALEDDPGTPVDERTWSGNAASAPELAKIASAGAIWFTGGDQLRTTRLLAPEGRETPMLGLIRARLADGAVVGGSSAGAAIMSRAMITEGEPLPALLNPVQRQARLEAGEPDNRRPGGGLVMGDGLGFLPRGLVDQHFDARHRLGRLARALFELPPTERFGFGIDEDSALVIDLNANRAEVVGEAGVTLLDARSAVRPAGPSFAATGLRLGHASAGDSLDLASLRITPAPRRKPVAPANELPVVPHGSGGMAVPEPPVADLLADALFATPGSTLLERPSFSPAGSLVFRFTRPPSARAFTGGGITLTDIGFAIRPLDGPSQGAGR
jgi:cyanophycinase